jgi:hypothetical protein
MNRDFAGLSLMRALPFHLLLFLAIFAGSECAAKPVLLASVRFRAVDPFGEPMTSGVHILRFKDVSGKDWARRFKEGFAVDIPYGVYDVSARSELWATEFSEQVVVEVPDVLVTAMFGLSNPEVGGMVTGPVRGDVVGLRGSGDPWCKLSGVFSRANDEAGVKASGSFDFGWVDVGTYVAVCGSGPEVQVMQLLRVYGGGVAITFHASPVSAAAASHP